MTGQEIAECTGGRHAITDEGMWDHYHTHSHAQLGASQGLELGFLIADALKEGRQALRVAAH